MITLGIESTAHTLGIGICRDGEILSNIYDTYQPLGEGIIPRKAADHHAEKFRTTLDANLSKAGLSLSEIDLFSFAQGPGIGSPLAVGCSAARFLSLSCKKPLI